MMTYGKQINELATGKFLKLKKLAPAGTLEARKLSSGVVMLYWRYTLDQKTSREVLGIYDPSAPPRSNLPTKKGYSIEAATSKAQELATQHYANKEKGGLPAIKKEQKAARLLEINSTRHAAEFTLAKLLETYCKYLQDKGRSSHRNVRSLFQLHVIDAFPHIATKPANLCTYEDFTDMMRKLNDAGKGRTSNKLRSYTHAAYEIARRVRADSSLPVVLKEFNVTQNPLAETVNLASANRPDKNPLDKEQMILYWTLIREVAGFKGALLKLHLLTGAQRMEQLTRLKTNEIQKDKITLWDGKGKPGKPPRKHLIPLTALCIESLKACTPSGEYALSTDGGKTRVAATTLAGWAQEIVGDKIPNFKAKRLRSGVETLLASKVSRDVRGRLQSHGFSGVQAIHYDSYEYMDEKLSALNALEQLLNNSI